MFVFSSDINTRIERCYAKVPEDRSISPKAMEKKIHEVDKKRAKYYNYYTDQIWGATTNYNLCVDTSAIDINTITELIQLVAKSTS